MADYVNWLTPYLDNSPVYLDKARKYLRLPSYWLLLEKRAESPEVSMVVSIHVISMVVIIAKEKKRETQPPVHEMLI